MRYRLAIFDFDGTLADSFPWFKSVLNDVAEKYGFRQIDDEEKESLRGCDAREILKRLEVPTWKVPFIARHLRRLKSEETHRVPLFEGSAELLRVLSEQGVRLAIVSSDSEANVRKVLGPEHEGLVHHYECSASIFGKSAKFRRVLRSSGFRTVDAICIGDELRDLDAARQVRIAFGAVSWGYTTREALSARSPEHLFSELHEIAECLIFPPYSFHSCLRK